jgi:hypothetical protein
MNWLSQASSPKTVAPLASAPKRKIARRPTRASPLDVVEAAIDDYAQAMVLVRRQGLTRRLPVRM